MSQPGDGKGKARVCNWTIHQDRVLLNLLIDQFRKNYCKDGTFKPYVFTDILVPFNEATRLNFTQIHLSNRWKNLKRTYHLYETLRSRSGWGWDESRQLPVPPDANAWTAAIASNRRYASIMNKPYPFREEMDILCSKTTCRGRLAFGSNQDVDLEDRRSFGDDDSGRQQFSDMGLRSSSTPAEEEDSFDLFAYYPSTQPSMSFNVGHAQTPPVNYQVGASQTPPNDYQVGGSQTPPVNYGVEDEATSPHKRFPTGSSSVRSRKRKGKVDTSKLQEYCALHRERLEVAKLFFPGSSTGSQRTEEVYTLKECFAKLKSLPGYCPDILYRAINLFKEVDNRAIFMALDDEDKLAWIIHEDE